MRNVRHNCQELTQREAEVAALIAMGLKNVSIARRLALSPATVATYVQRIQSRLGLSGRACIAAWARATPGHMQTQSRCGDARCSDGQPSRIAR